MKAIRKTIGCIMAATGIVGVTSVFAGSNTAFGTNALASVTTGTANSAFGFDALTNLTTGIGNTAIGNLTLESEVSGSGDTAVGDEALEHDTSAGGNTAVGGAALYQNTSGVENTAVGEHALEDSMTGSYNAVVGYQILNNVATGTSFNSALGAQALYDDNSGTNNVAVGFQSGYYIQGNDNIDIANSGNGTDSKITRIGTLQTNVFVAGIYGVTAASGVEVYVNSNGQLGTATSSRKYKDDIQSMGDSSDELLSLHPVTFKYKHDLDPQGIPQFGLVAEDVEKIDPGLVAHDAKGQPYTVRYNAINAMLLNEFLKEHRTVEDLQQKVGDLEKLVQSMSSKN